MSFGSQLRKARQNKLMTQEGVAKQIPMNQSNYSKIERDCQEPSLYQLRRISEILKVSTDFLLEINQNHIEKEKKDKFAEEVKTLLNKYFF
ncbi:MAG: helix-turn-helix transcriptional regulator [Erysipelotrichales bacterium]|nr:helix-turn-helix domain-containing protein [Bacilli bacterium]MDD3383714.1 helix-turn-helix transcriptional regulator [Bacilli bacterium]MDD4124094.1 helix-turn-helix transcriptional regulator [Bacilli bacterium]MEA4821175.1 helix-turn-helix transcriptional regulator [Erysipelotrichales bacterium]